VISIEELRPEIIVKSKKWPEPVEIVKVKDLGKYIRIVGLYVNSGKPVNQVISKEELFDLSIAKFESDLSGDPVKVFLAFETIRYRYASLYDPLLALNTSKIDPLPHQIEAVYGVILKLPQIRFLLADDPGAGKTIMAGLIIKELQLRGIANKILIVVPGHLKDQWRRELKDRFDEKFTVIDRGMIDAHYGENVWEKENKVITSMDFLKQDDIIQSIITVPFDLVIVDEAHKMSAYQYGMHTQKTSRYKLGEILSKNSAHLLFLTATPHRGDPENFRLFLDLLLPGFFATTEMLEKSIKDKDNPLFVRRVKEDLKDFEGKPLFLPREIRTISFRLSEKEKILYNTVSKYVKEQYNKALEKEFGRYIAFALVILQRRLASSTWALQKSLIRRKEKLEQLLKGPEKEKKKSLRPFDIEELEDWNEEERWKEEKIWETLSVAENRQQMVAEIQTLNDLINKATEIIKNEDEVKLKQLKETLIDLNKQYPEEKIIIFTESKDTLEYLQAKIKQWGYSVNTIHGGMKLEDRIEGEKIFKNETQILIATEAAGEGINLQFCHLMINYDIPWNPNRLEQRMGRIHRYGQKREVFVFNLVAQDTREGRVLIKLFEKLQEIKKALGNEKVFDVISNVMYGKNLSELMVEAAANARNTDDILKEIDIKIDEKYILQVKESLAESLATKFIDYTRIKEMAEKAREHKLIPEYTEAFFSKVLNFLKGELKERKDGLKALDRVPIELRRIADDYNFQKKYGKIMRSYTKLTFDKDIAFKNYDVEFISFGHPLFEAMMKYVEKEMFPDLRKGAIFEDPTGKLDGFILFYEGKLTDGMEEDVGKKLFAVYINEKTTETINPTILWDLIPGQYSREQIPIEELKENALEHVIDQMAKYRNQKLEERKREAHIKEKYGIKSLETLILKLDNDLIKLQKRKEKGENVDLAIRNKQEQKRKYEQALEDLEIKIEKEQTITMDSPKFLGIVKVLPKIVEIDGMVRDDEVEEIAMKVSMEYEKKQGRIPIDVSKEKIGFDIRSIDENGDILRRIEVKGRARVGNVVLSENEWKQANNLGDDFYLYIVYNCVTNPELKIIQNPAKVFTPEKVVKVMYSVSKEKILEEGENKDG